MARQRWDGIVIEVWADGDTFTADLRREDGTTEFEAEYSMRECGIEVQEGDVLDVTPESVTKVDLGVWTQEDIDEISRRAKEMYKRLRENCD